MKLMIADRSTVYSVKFSRFRVKRHRNGRHRVRRSGPDPPSIAYLLNFRKITFGFSAALRPFFKLSFKEIHMPNNGNVELANEPVV